MWFAASARRPKTRTSARATLASAVPASHPWRTALRLAALSALSALGKLLAVIIMTALGLRAGTALAFASALARTTRITLHRHERHRSSDQGTEYLGFHNLVLFVRCSVETGSFPINLLHSLRMEDDPKMMRKKSGENIDDSFPMMLPPLGQLAGFQFETGFLRQLVGSTLHLAPCDIASRTDVPTRPATACARDRPPCGMEDPK